MPSQRLLMILTAAALSLLAARPLTPQAPAVKIDGMTDDWSPLALSRDTRSGAEYAFRNDGRYLYVVFIVKDPKSRESIDSTGLVLLAGKATARKLERGVLFLKRPVAAETYIRWQESQGASLTEAETAKLRDMVQHDLCLTFAVGAGGSVQGPLRRLSRERAAGIRGRGRTGGRRPTSSRSRSRPPASSPEASASPPARPCGSPSNGEAPRGRSSATKATRETPPSEAGGLFGVATPAQEFLNMFDPHVPADAWARRSIRSPSTSCSS